ncbi:MAG: hypothetical protein JNK47_12875 [Mesorhizobium sp.]|nr:hypothetical protein [Mesorhizobium sp.]MBL8578113.1 hypothetical protein [Mesorhizobium sp.]
MFLVVTDLPAPETTKAKRAGQPLTDEEKRARKREYNRRWKAKNPEAVKAGKRRDYEKEKRNPEAMRKRREASHRWYCANIFRMKDNIARNLDRKRIECDADQTEGKAYLPEIYEDLAKPKSALLAKLRRTVRGDTEEREELVSMVVVALLEGKIPLPQLAEHVRRIQQIFYDQKRLICTMSLDRPAFADGRKTVGDRLTYDDVAW